MKAYVGVTDGDWYRHLSALDADEVNFWRPSGDRAFRALSVGEPFLFKTHSPHNRIVGGGFYSGFASLTISEAWSFFENANGASSLEELRARVARYRRSPLGEIDDPSVGCVFVRDVVWFEPNDLPAPPADFASNIVQGKTYDVASPLEAYFGGLIARLLGRQVIDLGDPWRLEGPMFGDPRLATQRLGQRSFQGVVLAAYGYQCAVTGDKIRPVLQAAHIRPVTRGGEHRLDNGLLLRSDVHTLFDQGYLGVDTRHRLQVSPRLRSEFGNGEEFYELAKSAEPISIPSRRADRPNREFLDWHMDEVFKAS